MNPEIRRLIARGTPLTGRRLLEALEAAARPPIGGRGMRVEGVGDRAILHNTQPRARGGQREIDALLGAATSFAANRWDYDWVEARLTTANNWEQLPEGRTSAELGPARNKAEFLNTGSVVAHGVTIPAPPPDVTLLPLPPGTPVTIRLIPDVEGTLHAWFDPVNAIGVEC